jgi:DNA-binding transcriptional ArsR family regulator
LSIDAISWAWRAEVESSTEKAVLVALADFANPDGEGIYPGIERIQRMTSLSRRSVQRSIRALEERGFVRATGRRQSGTIEYEMPGVGASEWRVGGATVAPDPLGEPSGDDVERTGTRKPAPSDEAAAIERVWACYVEVMEPRSKTLDLQTRKLIRNALKVASADECCGAIRGCKSSDFHMGVNDRRRKYNTISHILKGRMGKDTTRERVDFFLDLAAKAGVASDGTSVDPARLSNAKRDVRDAWEFPNDELVVKRGEESEAWLVAQGWRVEREEDGRPVFHRPES